MAGLDVIFGIITIVSFIFAVWVWMKSDSKINRLSEALETIYKIAGTALWESQVTVIEDNETKIRQAEKTLGFLESIRKISGQYATQKTPIDKEGAISQLVERNIVVTMATIFEIEQAKEITEVWVVTPDLKPDTSDRAVGKIVNKNIKNGKRYVYFYPIDLPHADTEIVRLFKNIGIMEARATKLQDRVKLIPLSREKYNQLSSNGNNIVLYFFDPHRSLLPRCFEEVYFTQVPERAAFWQEHSESKLTEFRHLLEIQLQDS